MSLRTAVQIVSRRSAVRAAPRALAVASRLSLPSTSFVRPAAAPLARQFSVSALRAKQQRDAWAANPIIGYDEVKKLADQPSDKVLLIDVRDTDEVALGTIPSAVNVPLGRLEEAFSDNFNPGDFVKEFAFQKPTYAQNIVFFCRSGNRSGMACELASKMGYPNVRNYAGSLLEWFEKEGKEYPVTN